MKFMVTSRKGAAAAVAFLLATPVVALTGIGGGVAQAAGVYGPAQSSIPGSLFLGDAATTTNATTNNTLTDTFSISLNPASPLVGQVTTVSFSGTSGPLTGPVDIQPNGQIVRVKMEMSGTNSGIIDLASGSSCNYPVAFVARNGNPLGPYTATGTFTPTSTGSTTIALKQIMFDDQGDGFNFGPTLCQGTNFNANYFASAVTQTAGSGLAGLAKTAPVASPTIKVDVTVNDTPGPTATPTPTVTPTPTPTSTPTATPTTTSIPAGPFYGPTQSSLSGSLFFETGSVGPPVAASTSNVQSNNTNTDTFSISLNPASPGVGNPVEVSFSGTTGARSGPVAINANGTIVRVTMDVSGSNTATLNLASGAGGTACDYPATRIEKASDEGPYTATGTYTPSSTGSTTFALKQIYFDDMGNKDGSSPKVCNGTSANADYYVSDVTQTVCSSCSGVTSFAKTAPAASSTIKATVDVVVPAAPGKPSAPTAVAGDGEATVSWSAASDTGGSAITGYTVTAVENATKTCTPTPATGLTCTVAGLTNDTPYTFTLVASNAIGDSTASNASNTVTPKAPTAPVAPSAPSAVAGDAQATVTWTAPSDNGGSAVTGYTVTAVEDAMKTCTPTPATALTCTVNGLTNDTAYTFTVVASNAIGTSSASDPSNQVIPRVQGASEIYCEMAVTGTRLWRDAGLFGAPAGNDPTFEVYFSPASVGPGDPVTTLVSFDEGIANGPSYVNGSVRPAATLELSSDLSVITALGTPYEGVSPEERFSGQILESQDVFYMPDDGSSVTATLLSVAFDTKSLYPVFTWPGFPRDTFSTVCNRSSRPLLSEIPIGTEGTISPYAPPPGPGNQTISVTPAGPYKGGEKVTVTARGFSPNAPVSIGQCPVGRPIKGPGVCGATKLDGAKLTTANAQGVATVELTIIVGSLENTLPPIESCGPQDPCYMSATSISNPLETTGTAGTVAPRNFELTYVGGPPVGGICPLPIGGSGSGVGNSGFSGADSSSSGGSGSGQTRDFSGQDLSNLDLTYCDFDNANFTNSNLSGSNFTGSSLRFAIFAGANLTGATFPATDLYRISSGSIIGFPAELPSGWSTIQGYLVGPYADLEFADLAGTDFAGIDLRGVDFDGAILSGAKFDNIDLCSASFVGADLTSAQLTRIRQELPLFGPSCLQLDMKGANLDGANLLSADLSGASLDNSSFVLATLSLANLSRASFINADLSQANLGRSTVEGVDLESALLSRVKSGYLVGVPLKLPSGWYLIGGHLVGMDADLTLADLQNQNLTFLDLSQAILKGANLRGSTLALADLRDADLRGADLRDTYIDGTNMVRAQLAGVRSGGITGRAMPLPAGWKLINGFLTQATVSSSPSALSGVVGDRQVVVSWLAPSSDGGAALTGYVVSSGGVAVCSVTVVAPAVEPATSCTVSGLVNGTGYSFTVRAFNAVGGSVASDVSGVLVPRSVPDAPSGVVGVAGDRQVSLSWNAPSSDGGSALTGYKVFSAGVQVCSVSVVIPALTPATSCTITGLTNGTPATYSVKATNIAGMSPGSAYSSQITPRTIPTIDGVAPLASMTAPTARFVTSQSIGVSWSASDAETSVASSDVSWQRVQTTGGTASAWVYPTAWQGTSVRSVIFSGASLGYRYCFRTRARDVVGNVSPWSASSCTNVPFDDRSLVATPGWTRPAVSGWIKGTGTSTTVAGETLSTTGSVKARRISLVATQCPTCGLVVAYVGTTAVGTVSLYKAGSAQRSIVNFPALASAITGKVSIVVVSKGRTVRIDGVGISAN